MDLYGWVDLDDDDRLPDFSSISIQFNGFMMLEVAIELRHNRLSSCHNLMSNLNHSANSYGFLKS